MSTIHHYRSNLRDIFFNLFELWPIQEKTLGKAPFDAMDEETVREVLQTFETFCTQELATSFAADDREGLKRDSDGNVFLPQGLKSALAKYYEGEWQKLEHPAHLDGYGAPPSVIWAYFEMMIGANPPLGFYLLGNFAALIVDQHGTDDQKARFLKGLTQGWGATMVLTEPDAGSDVGAGRTKAKHVEGEIWEIEGVKRFITNGDFDGTDNIMHMVLARPEGAPAGTKGLSMFLVPKYWVEEDGSIGELNGAVCSNLENKMGLKASATCEMTFGADKPCRGFLLGNSHDGIKKMFNVIEYARMGVGIKSMSTLSTAYLNALEYTKERVQGPDLAQAQNKDAPRVAVIKHPDVRRSLMRQKSYAEALRSLVFFTASQQDAFALAQQEGNQEAAMALHRRVDLLLPLVKGFSSERVYELLAESLQCLGGSGYCKDYPHEQYIRDQKIDTLYEGTTAIQGLDLIFRKIMRDGGNTLRVLLGEVHADLKQNIGGDDLENQRMAVGIALQEFGKILELMTGHMGKSVYHAGLHSSRMLFSFAELLLGWLLLKQAAIAVDKLPKTEGDDIHFYQGKIAACTFFCQEELPRVSMARQVVEQSTLYLMDMNDQAF